MSGKTSELTPLEMRKQLLLVESELNRVYFINELQAVQAGAHELGAQVSGLRTLVASGGQLLTTLGGLFRGPAAEDDDHGHAAKNGSWLSTLAKGVRTGLSFWAALQNDRR